MLDFRKKTVFFFKYESKILNSLLQYNINQQYRTSGGMHPELRSLSPIREGHVSLGASPARHGSVGLHDMSATSHSMINEASRMLMELEANKVASEQARRIASPRAGGSLPPHTPTYVRTASPMMRVLPPGTDVSVMKKDLSRQAERVRDVEKEKLKIEHDLKVKLAIKEDLLKKLNEELHVLVQKDAVREEEKIKMDTEVRDLRSQLSSALERLALQEADMTIRERNAKGSDSQLHDLRLGQTKTANELERLVRMKEKLEEMLAISQRSVNDLTAQLATKDDVIRNMEDSLRDVDAHHSEITRAMEDKSRTDVVRMEEVAKRNESLQKVVEDLRHELSQLADEKQYCDTDYSTQVDRMVHSEATLQERLATAQKTIDCIEAQLAAVKAEHLAAAQDTAVRQEEMELEIKRLRDQLAQHEDGDGMSAREHDIQKIRILEDRLDDMILQDSSAQDRYHSLQAEVEKMRGDADKYREAHKRALAQLEQERAAHRKALDEAASKVREAERAMQEAEDARGNITADKQRLQDEVKTLQDDMRLMRSQREAERQRLDDALSAAQERMSAAKSMCVEHEKRADAAEDERDHLRMQLQESESQSARHQSALVKLRIQMDQLKSQINEERAGMASTVNEKQLQLEEARSELYGVQNQLERAKSEVQSLRDELRKKDEARQRLADQLEIERDEQKSILDKALKESKELAGRLREELDGAQRNLNDERRALRDAHELIQELRDEKDRLVSAFDEELEQLRQANLDKVTELKRQLQRCESRSNTAELQVQRLTSQVKDLEEELERERERYRQLQDQLDEERSSHRKLNSDRMNDLRVQKQDLQNQLAAKDAELAEALRKIDQLALDLERAEKALRTKAHDLEVVEMQHRRDRENWNRVAADHEEAMQRAQGEISDLRLKVQEALDDAERARQQCRSAQTDGDLADAEKQRRIQQLKDKLAQAEEQNAQAQNQLLQLQGQLDDAADNVADALKQAQMKDAELRRSEDKLKKYQAAGEQLMQMQDKNEALEEQHKKQRRELESLGTELQDMQRRLDNMKNRRQEDDDVLKELRDKMAHDREAQQAELRRKGDEIGALQRELANAKTDAKDSGKKTMQLQEQMHSMRRDDDTYTRYGNNDDLRNLQDALQQAIEDKSDLERRLLGRGDERDTSPSGEDVENLRRELSEAREKIRTLIDQNNSAKLTIAELEARVQELEGEKALLEEKSRELEARSSELSFLLGTRAQLVAQIMSLREAYVPTTTTPITSTTTVSSRVNLNSRR